MVDRVVASFIGVIAKISNLSANTLFLLEYNHADIHDKFDLLYIHKRYTENTFFNPLHSL